MHTLSWPRLPLISTVVLQQSGAQPAWEGSGQAADSADLKAGFKDQGDRG